MRLRAPPEAKGHPATRCKPLRGCSPQLKCTGHEMQAPPGLPGPIGPSTS